MLDTHPTYCEQIEGLLQEVQHMRLSVLDARQVFLQLIDQVALETLEDYVKSQRQTEMSRPEKTLIVSSH